MMECRILLATLVVVSLLFAQETVAWLSDPITTENIQGVPSAQRRRLGLSEFIGCVLPNQMVSRSCAVNTGLYQSSSSGDNDDDNDDEPKSVTPPKLERLAISGVSIAAPPAPVGFHLLLEATKGALAVRLTSDAQDAYAATSPEALTILQLLSGVDMAGPLLPPETLAKLVVLEVEAQTLLLEDLQEHILDAVQNELPEGVTSYAEANPWLQSRMTLPKITLDQLTLISSDPGEWHCQLHCKVKGQPGTLQVCLSPELVQAVTYQYDPATSGVFLGVALALRYKAPLLLRDSETVFHYPSDHIPAATNDDVDEDERPAAASVQSSLSSLDDWFPQRTTVAKLQQQSTRVTKNIERGFEIHKLTKALEIARRLGDTAAEGRIRAELDRMDSFHELPTTKTEEPSEEDSSKDERVVDEGVSQMEDDKTSFQ